MKLVVAALAVAAVAQAEPVAKPPHGATRITIDYARVTLSNHVERHFTLAWDGSGYAADNGRRVDAALIDTLYRALAPTRETTEELSCNSHTDDYPAFEIAIDGDEPVELTSTSNCGSYAPWNIERGGKLFAQFSGATWLALEPLFVAVGRTWRVEPWDTGGGAVLLAIYSPAEGVSTSDAERCARSLEANAPLRRFFGAPIRVEQLGVSCDTSRSPDCTTTQTNGTIAFGPIVVHVDLACANGVASVLPQSLDRYKPALTFVASKPVRALVAAMGGATVQLKLDRYSCKLEPDVEGIPQLSWVPGDATIWLHAIGARNKAFWHALAIDPEPLVTSVGGVPVIDEKIDFSGKLVR